MLSIRRKAVAFTHAQRIEMHEFMETTVKRTPNPRNPKTFLKRVQCTFVPPGIAEYEFGQFNETFRYQSESQMPAAARTVLAHAKGEAAKFGCDPSLYNGVHVNLYRDGSVGVRPHFDKESSMLAGMPIFSYTMLVDGRRPRAFRVYELDGVTEVGGFDGVLHDGDLLVMHGDFQRRLKHGVNEARPHRAYAPRLNFTVRAFRPEKLNSDSSDRLSPRSRVKDGRDNQANQAN